MQHRITLRKGSRHVEIETTVHNFIRDHRLRLFCPIGLTRAKSFWADTPFDAVERPIQLRENSYLRREIQVEMTPQQNWVATTDGERGLALIAPGQYESAVLDQPDRPLCLTLLRAFRRAVFTDGNDGGQIQGIHKFRIALKPFDGAVPASDLFLVAHALAAPARTIYLESHDLLPVSGAAVDRDGECPRITGPVVLSASHLVDEGTWLFRLFNPGKGPVQIQLVGGKSWRMTNLRGDASRSVDSGSFEVAPKQIITFQVEL